MIGPLRDEQIDSVVKLHSSSLKGDFLPSLGSSFLTTFYQALINEPNIYALVYSQEGQIQGFVIGTNDMAMFFKKILKKRFLKFSLLSFYQVIKNPRLLKKIYETLFYTKKESGPKAELVIIAVDQKHRNKGIGKALIKSLEEIFLKNKIRQYKLTAIDGKKAVGFYGYLKFKQTASFNLYGKKWLIFEKNITHQSY